MRKAFILLIAVAGISACKQNSCSKDVKNETLILLEQFESEVKQRQATGVLNEHKYAEAGIESALQFELWISKIRAYTMTDEVGALAEMFRYPMEVNRYDGSGKRQTTSSSNKPSENLKVPKIQISSASDFCKHYKYFMTDELKQLIANQRLDALMIDSSFGGRVIFDSAYFQVSRIPGITSEKYHVTFLFN